MAECKLLKWCVVFCCFADWFGACGGRPEAAPGANKRHCRACQQPVRGEGVEEARWAWGADIPHPWTDDPPRWCQGHVPAGELVPQVHACWYLQVFMDLSASMQLASICLPELVCRLPWPMEVRFICFSSKRILFDACLNSHAAGWHSKDVQVSREWAQPDKPYWSPRGHCKQGAHKGVCEHWFFCVKYSFI